MFQYKQLRMTANKIRAKAKKKMSTGKRLAKRSIVGTRVCAVGVDRKWYSGVIQAVKQPLQPATAAGTPRDTNANCINLTPDTKYVVRFDAKQDCAALGIANGRRPVREFRDTELIGPGFQNVSSVLLCAGQRVYITYNGRESAGEVLRHDEVKDEVAVRIPGIGNEAPVELKIHLEEIRLLESRRSARLADQERDTDFARLADMAGDRRRTSHNIDIVPAAQQSPAQSQSLPMQPQSGSRKRRPSFTQQHHHPDATGQYMHRMMRGHSDTVNECNAALVLMSLSGSPHSAGALHNLQSVRAGGGGGSGAMMGSSPGGSSTSSWSSSESSSLSDEYAGSSVRSITSSRFRTTSLSMSDEGIGMDCDETPRKRRVSGNATKDFPQTKMQPFTTPRYQCTWKGCGTRHNTIVLIEAHIREAHLGRKKPRPIAEEDDPDAASDYEEDFYYTEVEDEVDQAPSPPSPPTLSHRDMARPPHEDPEYQRKLVGDMRQGLLQLSSHVKALPSHSHGPINIPTSPLAHHNYTWTTQRPISPQKHVRLSPRPSTSYAPYPSPTFTHAIATAQHNLNLAVGKASPNQQQTTYQHQYAGHTTTIQQRQPLASPQPPTSNHPSLHSNNNNTNSPNHNLHSAKFNQHMAPLNLSHSVQQSQQTSVIKSVQQEQQQQLHNSHQHHQQQQTQPQNLHQPSTSATTIHTHPQSPAQPKPHKQPTTGHHHAHLPSPASPKIQQLHQNPPPSNNNQQIVQPLPFPALPSDRTNGSADGAAVHPAAAAIQPAASQSPTNRRQRGENKKCRKVYGMDHKELWCTQCKWKKACSRFGE